MKTLFSGKISCLILCSVLGMAIGEASANTISISDSPLQTALGVPPNILFVIDDSGSMRWGYTPDSLASLNSELVCRKIEYAGTKNTCGSRIGSNAYLASSKLNTSYYDPLKTYTPPKKADGTLFASASFTNAPVNGYDPASVTVNLATNYRAIMDDYYKGSCVLRDAENKCIDVARGFTISPYGDDAGYDGLAGRAFYYQYNSSNTGCGTNEKSSACYTLVRIEADTAKEQNFANWFSYYRTRIQTAKWGVGQAFNTIDDDIRVGYGAINHNGVVQEDVAPFSSSRSSFYNKLYNQNAGGVTPLRIALNEAGKYYSTEKPWRDNPADVNSPIRSCRQSFTMLMTDGYYSDDYSGVANADNEQGPLIKGPGSQSYQYDPIGPYKDGFSNTLADIAMYYWNRDLLPDNVDNRVPVRNGNPAFWQNMTTFGVSLGLTGTITADTAFSTKEGTDLDWKDPQINNKHKLDDLLHAALNSRGSFFNANDATDFASKLANALEQITKGTGSASNLGGVSTSSQTGAKVFQGRYQSEDWAGDLWTYDADNGMQVSWKASEGIPSHEHRKITYFKGNTLSKFDKDNVTHTELALSSAEVINHTKIIDYLRGDQTYELGKKDGIFRVRSSLLGDIAHSAPLYVGAAERKNYHRNGWKESASYLSFIEANKSRKGVVYVGANDGMLHAFSDDANLGNGAGKELFAYVPKAVLPRLKHLASPNYQHQYYVDGVLTGGDAFIGSKWKTLVIGTLGRGAAGSTNSIFALDATDPAAITPLWEAPYTELGQNTGKVLIARSIDETWIGIVGYGYNNSTNNGGILVFNLATGAEIKKIALPSSTAAPNGFGQLESWDIDMDGNVDYVYAGDYLGNIWKFDLSSTQTNKWSVANNGNPIFTAAINGEAQPITAGISISREPSTGKTWIMFGTGSYLSSGDKTSTSKQSIYGVIDETDGLKTSITLTRNNLVERTYQEAGDYRSLEYSSELDSAKKGWYIDLGTGGERVVLPPLMIDSVLVINTLQPDSDPCKAGGISWRMAIDPFKGGRLKRNFFETENFSDGVPTSGVKTESPTVGYTVIRTKDKSGKPIYTEVSGQGDASTPPARPINVVALGRRLTWRELSNE